MLSRYEHTACLAIGSNERELLITYTVTPGGAETGPSYDCAGEPGWPAEVEIESVEVEVIGRDCFGKPAIKAWEPAPRWLIDIIENDSDMHSDMLSQAGEDV